MQDSTTQTISRSYTDRVGGEHPKRAMEMVALILSILVVLLLFPMSLLFIFRVTQQYERAVIFRLGRLKKGAAKGPGLLYVLPCIDDFIKVDLRTVTFDVPSQEVLTKDSCSVAVDAVVYYRVEQPLEAVLRVTHYKQASWTLAATTLRNVLGQKTLAEILIERETLSNLLQSILDKATHLWGVKVERVEIKDVRLPTQMQRAMAAEAEAMREARALLIAADGELRAAENLKNASTIISSSPAALKKFLQRDKMRRDQTTMTEDEVGAPLTKKSFSEAIFVYLSYFIMIITLPFSLLFVFKVVREYQRAVIFRLGKLRKGRARGPGLFFILPCVDKYINVDLRIETLPIQPQEVLTKDSCTVEVDAVVYYKVFDPLNAIIKVDNFRKASWLLAATTLRNVLGQKNMMEILSERAGLAEVMRTLLDSATYPWGVSIGRVEIKDVRLPPNMQRAMAAEAEATREARAKVIVTEGEMQAATSMKEAADILGESPAALQLRYMQTLTSINSEKTSTVVFPFPINLISQ